MVCCSDSLSSTVLLIDIVIVTEIGKWEGEEAGARVGWRRRQQISNSSQCKQAEVRQTKRTGTPFFDNCPLLLTARLRQGRTWKLRRLFGNFTFCKQCWPNSFATDKNIFLRFEFSRSRKLSWSKTIIRLTLCWRLTRWMRLSYIE